MSNNNPNEYEYIKALVRGLHIQKNVSRPDAALLSPQPYNDEPDTTSITEDDDDDYEDNRRLPTVAESSAASSRRGSEMRLSKNELARLRKQHKQTLRSNKKSPQPEQQTQRHQSPIHHRSNHSLNIPSVVVTGANEHTDLLTTTQRRFSQLYSGLRRFSTSHTVRVLFFFDLRVCGCVCLCVRARYISNGSRAHAHTHSHTHLVENVVWKWGINMPMHTPHTHTQSHSNNGAAVLSVLVCMCVVCVRVPLYIPYINIYI